MQAESSPPKANIMPVEDAANAKIGNSSLKDIPFVIRKSRCAYSIHVGWAGKTLYPIAEVLHEGHYVANVTG